MKTITISDASFALLSRWASVGRTIDAAINELPQTEQGNWTADELLRLKLPLDECNAACKSVRFQEELEAYRLNRKGV